MYLLTKYNTVLISLASLTSIFSFLTLLFASVESRKKNIYKTAPFITISFDDKEEKLYVKKLNNNIAKNIKIEPLLFYNQNKADDFLNPFKSKRLIFKPKTLQTYLINTTEELELSINNQGYDETTWNAIYYSFLKKTSSGLYIFYKDFQNHKFYIKLSKYNEKIKDSTLDIRKGPKHISNFNLFFWFIYLMRYIKYYLLTTKCGNKINRIYNKIRES